MTQVIARAVEIDNQPHINGNVNGNGNIIDMNNHNDCEELEELLHQS